MPAAIQSAHVPRPGCREVRGRSNRTPSLSGHAPEEIPAPPRPGHLPSGSGAHHGHLGGAPAGVGRVVRLRRPVHPGQHHARLRQGAEHAPQPAGHAPVLRPPPAPSVPRGPRHGHRDDRGRRGRAPRLARLEVRRTGAVRFFGDTIPASFAQTETPVLCRIRPAHVVALDTTGPARSDGAAREHMTGPTGPLPVPLPTPTCRPGRSAGVHDAGPPRPAAVDSGVRQPGPRVRAGEHDP